MPLFRRKHAEPGPPPAESSTGGPDGSEIARWLNRCPGCGSTWVYGYLIFPRNDDICSLRTGADRASCAPEPTTEAEVLASTGWTGETFLDAVYSIADRRPNLLGSDAEQLLVEVERRLGLEPRPPAAPSLEPVDTNSVDVTMAAFNGAISTLPILEKRRIQAIRYDWESEPHHGSPAMIIRTLRVELTDAARQRPGCRFRLEVIGEAWCVQVYVSWSHRTYAYRAWRTADGMALSGLW